MHTWTGADTDWQAVEMTVRGARLVQRLAVENGLHADVVSRCLSQRPELLRVAERASAASTIFREAWSVWIDMTASSDQAWCDQASLAEADLGRLEAALDEIDRRFADLDDWVAWNATWKGLSAGMLGAAATWAVSPAAREARGKLDRRLRAPHLRALD